MDIWTDSKLSGDRLKVYYRWELWKALLQHAPKCIAFLRKHGSDAWIERYRLPIPRDWLNDYLADPEGYLALGFAWTYIRPVTPPLSIPEYKPAVDAPQEWREQAIRLIDQHMSDVEAAYARAGWHKARLKYKREHFDWLALRIEGLSWAQIADRTEPPAADDAVAKAVKRLAEVLGVDICQ